MMMAFLFVLYSIQCWPGWVCHVCDRLWVALASLSGRARLLIFSALYLSLGKHLLCPVSLHVITWSEHYGPCRDSLTCVVGESKLSTVLSHRKVSNSLQSFDSQVIQNSQFMRTYSYYGRLMELLSPDALYRMELFV